MAKAQKKQVDKGIRVRGKDLQAAIFQPFTHKTNKEDLKVETIVYTLFGKHDDLDNEYPILFDIEYEDTNKIVKAIERPEAYAKKISQGKQATLFVKRGANGKLYNPMGLYNDTQGERKKMSLDTFKFVRVNKRTFDLYLNFLKTQNIAYLNQAERELV